MLVACINSEWLGNACLAGVVLVLLLGLWALYAHMLHKVSLQQQAASVSGMLASSSLWLFHPHFLNIKHVFLLQWNVAYLPLPHRHTRVPALVKHCLPSPLWPSLSKSAIEQHHLHPLLRSTAAAVRCTL
jgi:hypothetical protein